MRIEVDIYEEDLVDIVVRELSDLREFYREELVKPQTPVEIDELNRAVDALSIVLNQYGRD